MRAFIYFSKNTAPIPLNYQNMVRSKIHEWLGKNNPYHDKLSEYCFSNLRGKSVVRGGYISTFNSTPCMYISAVSEDFIRSLISGIMEGSEFIYGMKVLDVRLETAPKFKTKEYFYLGSPIFIKRRIDTPTGSIEKYYYWDDPESDELMTETLLHKLRASNKPELQVKVRFDRSFPEAKSKSVIIKNHRFKASECPVILEGDPEAIAFAWDCGIGSSTGLGFGALN